MDMGLTMRARIKEEALIREDALAQGPIIRAVNAVPRGKRPLLVARRACNSYIYSMGSVFTHPICRLSMLFCYLYRLE